MNKEIGVKGFKKVIAVAAMVPSILIGASEVASAQESQDSSRNTDKIATSVIGEAWSSENSPFIDVFPNDPYYTGITELNNLGVIEGYKNGSILEFRPNDMLKRAQFAKIIVKALSIPVSEQDISRFKDVEISGPESFYPDNYIAAAVREGIIKGKTEEEFGPYEDLTRDQTATMLIRALSKLPGLLDEIPDGYNSSFNDESNIHSENLKKAEYNSLFYGIDLGKNGGTRGETAQIVFNALEIISINKWISDNGLDKYGNPNGTKYAGGNPLFNEKTGEVTGRYEYILTKHPDKPWTS